MRTATFNYIKQILADYNHIDEHIKKREEELRAPFRESDVNSGIKSNYTKNDQNDRMLITIEQDRRLAALERNKRIVTNLLAESCADTQTIIRELYMKKRPEYTLQGLVENKKIYCSRSKAAKLRTVFFEEMAKKLDLNL